MTDGIQIDIDADATIAMSDSSRATAEWADTGEKWTLPDEQPPAEEVPR